MRKIWHTKYNQENQIRWEAVGFNMKIFCEFRLCVKCFNYMKYKPTILYESAEVTILKPNM